MKKKLLSFAFLTTLPVFFGYLFLGIAFGLLLADAGYGAPWALFMSIFVYAGSAQFMLAGLLAGNTSILTASIMTLLINSRHMFYGLSFLEKFRQMGRRYPYMVFSLTDETYSLICSLKVPPEYSEDDALFLISLLDHLYWIFGSVLGALLGQIVPFDTTGIDFAMTTLFIVIFTEQWLSCPTHLPAILGLCCAVISLVIFGPSNFILPALIVTVTLLFVCRRYLEPFTKEEEQA